MVMKRIIISTVFIFLALMYISDGNIDGSLVFTVGFFVFGTIDYLIRSSDC